MRVAVLGASGIIGQHVRLRPPRGVQPTYFRQKSDLLHHGIDEFDVRDFDVVVNLAGESRPDVVERNPGAYLRVNYMLPERLSRECKDAGKRYVHISTQAVFPGTHAPYTQNYRGDPMVTQANEYGKRKADAEVHVRHNGGTILRPTFVLGVRPMPGIGRRNPLEQMLEEPNQTMVDDRFFSISWARDVAADIWEAATGKRTGTHNIGAGRYSRYSLAHRVADEAMKAVPGYAPVIQAVSHDSMAAEFGLAPRPLDTTYAGEEQDFTGSLDAAINEWVSRGAWDWLQRARELALFLGIPLAAAMNKLYAGFVPLHGEVRKDWLRANPESDDDILHWYRTTESYLWELSAYHADQGWNYRLGTCKGIIDRLVQLGTKRVLCLGDGIGDLTMWSRQAGMDAVYHDLADSRTSMFARSRYLMYTGQDLPCDMTAGWVPDFTCGPYDAIASLDFLEHVTDVPAWARAIHAVLKPGGYLVAQNAFGIGSEGSIPCHLQRNDRFEKDWTPLLFSLGFTHEGSIWWKKS